jgi:ferredoxin
MKVHVNSEICQGHTLCAMTAPQLFGLREEDGHSYAISEDVPEGQEAAAREAARACPEQAIVISALARAE